MIWSPSSPPMRWQRFCASRKPEQWNRYHGLLFLRLASTLSMAATAMSCMSGKTCEYRSRVMATLACPSISETTLAGTPFSNNRVTAVCRRSCTRKRGRRALSVTLWKRHGAH